MATMLIIEISLVILRDVMKATPLVTKENNLLPLINKSKRSILKITMP